MSSLAVDFRCLRQTMPRHVRRLPRKWASGQQRRRNTFFSGKIRDYRVVVIRCRFAGDGFRLSEPLPYGHRAGDAATAAAEAGSRCSLQCNSVKLDSV